MNKDLDIQILEDARTIVHHDDCLPAEAPLKHKKHHDHQAVDLDWLLESRFDDSDLQDWNSSADLLDGCNTPSLMAQEAASFGCFQAAAAATPNSAMRSESQRPYPAPCHGSKVMPSDPQYNKVHDEVLDRLIQCRFDEGNMKDTLPSTADLVDGCNRPHHMAVFPSCAADAVDSCPTVVMRYSEQQRPYPALRRGSSLPRDSRSGPSPPTPTHAFGSLSLSDRQLLAVARASTRLREFSAPKAELDEVSYTDCDLSYLVNTDLY